MCSISSGFLLDGVMLFFLFLFFGGGEGVHFAGFDTLLEWFLASFVMCSRRPARVDVSFRASAHALASWGLGSGYGKPDWMCEGGMWESGSGG